MGSNEAPASKKAKLQDDDELEAPATTTDEEKLIDQAWEHYRTYRDDDGGEIDELTELLEILSQTTTVRKTDLEALLLSNKGVVSNRSDLLPVLVSVAHCVLAEHGISDLLRCGDEGEAKHVLRQQIDVHLQASLEAFPDNAATWSMAANYIRMTNTSSTNSPSAVLAVVYIKAAEKAHMVRRRAIEWLQSESVPGECKEWIELLLLNQVAGVELMDDVEEEDNSDSKDGNEEVEEWSASSVEGTARFMAAMLSSITGDHDAAARQLQYLPSLTHRLHPNLWKKALEVQMTKSQPAAETNAASKPTPLSFQSPSGILPSPLYERLCEVFHPGAPYWTESDYSNRGYYSYFMDLAQTAGTKDFQPSNLIEDAVCNHLLPLVQQQLADDQQIVGYEWWIHTRAVASNLGHNLHFDTDEALLAQDQTITHPAFSSVLYLTGGSGGGGATVLLDQTPDSKENAASAWLARPVDNSFMTFPGNLLHGVLPCPGTTSDKGKGTISTTAAIGTMTDDEMFTTLSSLLEDSLLSDEEEATPSHRLTFMVGFWTRRVPDRMKERNLYGPCGPLPPIEGTTWVQEIHKGYTDNNGSSNSEDDRCHDITPMTLPYVTPAWEEINQQQDVMKSLENSPPLEFARAIDHRFFVPNAPVCFRDSLFEKDECDEDDDQSADEEDEENGGEEEE